MSSRNFATGFFWVICAALPSAYLTAADGKKPEKQEEGVVIDFSNWSVKTDVDVTLQIEYDGLMGRPATWGEGPGFEPADFAQAYYESLKTAGVRVERFDGTKVRILGWEDKQGVFHKAMKGTVTSKTLKPELLPKVINPGKRG